MTSDGAIRSVRMTEGDGDCGTADSTPPRHRTQAPSDDAGSWCCEVDAGSSVQPSGQQTPSIAFSDANKTSVMAATSFRTH